MKKQKLLEWLIEEKHNISWGGEFNQNRLVKILSLLLFITVDHFLFWCEQRQLFFVLKWSTSLSWDCGAFVALLSNAITAHRGTEAGADCSCLCVSVTQALMTEESPVTARFTLRLSHIQLSFKVFAMFIMFGWMSLNFICSWFNLCLSIDFGHWPFSFYCDMDLLGPK